MINMKNQKSKKAKNLSKMPENLSETGFENYTVPKNQRPQIRQDVIQLISEITRPIKTLSRQHTSYGLKHRVETILNNYVSNGELIASMIAAGYDYKQCPNGSKNCRFCMAKMTWYKVKPTDNMDC